jgi:hypothetical protein
MQPKTGIAENCNSRGLNGFPVVRRRRMQRQATRVQGRLL